LRTDGFDRDELKNFLACLLPQNALICRFMLETGLRVSDVLKLEAGAFKQQMTVTESKTGMKRRVRLTKDLYNAVLAQAGRRWLFEGRNPEKHKTRQAVWYDLKRAGKAFRLREVLAPHSMRKSYAQELYYDRGKSLDEVQRILGHKFPSTTLFYLWRGGGSVEQAQKK